MSCCIKTYVYVANGLYLGISIKVRRVTCCSAITCFRYRMGRTSFDAPSDSCPGDCKAHCSTAESFRQKPSLKKAGMTTTTVSRCLTSVAGMLCLIPQTKQTYANLRAKALMAGGSIQDQVPELVAPHARVLFLDAMPLVHVPQAQRASNQVYKTNPPINCPENCPSKPSPLAAGAKATTRARGSQRPGKRASKARLHTWRFQRFS